MIEINYPEILESKVDEKLQIVITGSLAAGYQIHHFRTCMSDKPIRYLQVSMTLAAYSKETALEEFKKIIANSKQIQCFEFHEERLYLRKPYDFQALDNLLEKEAKWANLPIQSCYYRISSYSSVKSSVRRSNEIINKFQIEVLFDSEFEYKQKIFYKTVYKVKYGTETIGSAFSVLIGDQNIIVTAGHVADKIGMYGAISGTLLTHEGFQIDVTGVSKHSNRDLAVLKVNNNPRLGLQLGKTEFTQIEDKIYSAGFPAINDSLTISVGHISQTGTEYDGLSDLFQISGAAINPNNSGGPVTDSQFKVLGVLVSRAVEEGTRNFSFFERIEYLDEIELNQ